MMVVRQRGAEIVILSYGKMVVCDSRVTFATEKSDLKTISPTYNTTPETGLSVIHEMIGTFLLTD